MNENWKETFDKNASKTWSESLKALRDEFDKKGIKYGTVKADPEIKESVDAESVTCEGHIKGAKHFNDEVSKGKELLKNTNKMLMDCINNNSDKLKAGAAQAIMNAIDENNAEYEKCIHAENCCTVKKETPNGLSVPSDFTPNMPNRFLIEIDSALFTLMPWTIRSFRHDRWNRLVVTVAEDSKTCLPMILETSAEKRVSYIIKKKILSPDNETVYSTVYTGCRVFDYTESPLDYESEEIRTFTIIFDYADYTHEC